MAPELIDQRALVTGGAGGLGEEICLALAEAGARVILHDLPDAPIAAVRSKIDARNFRHKIEVVTGDLFDLESLKIAIGTIQKSGGPIEILVNNAAVNPRDPIESYSLEHFSRVQTINAHAAFVLCQAVVPAMKELGRGAIVNIGSLTLAGLVADMVPYVFAKGSLLGLTRSLAREAGPAGIRVNMVSPGAIPTELERRVWAGRLAEVEADVLARQALKYRGSPRDIAEAVLFLVSPRSRFITGHELNVNGGWYMG
jgi:3-oxoacyl-[acyl-carrier protein] reductase